MLNGIVSDNERLAAKWRRRFLRKKRPQNCERLGNNGDGKGHNRCCAFHGGRFYRNPPPWQAEFLSAPDKLAQF
jgi:hypothetical protein